MKYEHFYIKPLNRDTSPLAEVVHMPSGLKEQASTSTDWRVNVDIALEKLDKKMKGLDFDTEVGFSYGGTE